MTERKKKVVVAQHRPVFSVRAMCRCLSIHPSGFYSWLKQPSSNRALEDQRQTDLIRQVWDDSGKVYGYRKIHDDLLDMGESSCPNRVARLASLAGIRAQIGYKRKHGKYGGKPSLVVDNHLNWQFEVEAPNMVWVTDITYIKTQEGFAYLAVVIDLFSRMVVGWSLQQRQTTDVVLRALLMAVWRRKPRQKVLIHSDQGSQFTSIDWATFLRQHNLEHSMSRRAIAMTMLLPKAFSTCSRENASGDETTKQGLMPDRTSSTTSKCSTIQNANTLQTKCSRQPSTSDRKFEAPRCLQF